MITQQRPSEAVQPRRSAGSVPPSAERAKPPGARSHGSLGISFLDELDQPAEAPILDEWQRYVDDRLRHYSISHR